MSIIAHIYSSAVVIIIDINVIYCFIPYGAAIKVVLMCVCERKEHCVWLNLYECWLHTDNGRD